MKANVKYIEVKEGRLSALILNSGDIHKILFDNSMINMYANTALDGSLYNIYLKVEEEFTQLIGVNSPSSFSILNNQVFYKGIFNGVEYLVTFTFFDNTWFVDVDINSNGNSNISLYYGIDVGLANDNCNEAYNCQYIDHNVIKRDNSYIVLSKQNQGRPLLLETSSLNQLDSYSTDGFQFFTKNYKFEFVPTALRNKHLENKNYQYEFAYIALKTVDEKITKKTYTFYHHIEDNYHEFPSKESDISKIKELYNSIKRVDINDLKFNKIKLKHSFSHTLMSLAMTNEEVDELFEERRNIELDSNKNYLSFFTTNNSHVVLQDKERYVERPTGMVYISNGFKEITRSPMAFTCYMNGMFASHIVLGNTDFNSFTSESKTPLNILKANGLRIFVFVDNDYRLLTLPALFKMEINSATWYYKINNDLLTVCASISYDENKIEFEINSKNNIKYDLLITNSINMGRVTPKINIENNSMDFYFDNSTMAYQKYPNLHYTYTYIDNNLDVTGDSFFFEDVNEDNYPIIVHKVNQKSNVKLLISADYEDKKDYSFEEISVLNDRYYNNFKENILNIEVNGNDYLAKKINDLTIWYVQNALIHYSSPHGLEQYSGAAWGCRDVCQGPFEMFLTFNNKTLAKDVLLKVYSRQFVHNHDWPQWFMFDEYANIQAGDSHGDVIVWPLKAMSQYLERFNDLSILDEVAPYFNFHKGIYDESKDSIFNHMINEIKAIENSFVNGYNLSSYGGGDWDDTLQPKDRNQAKNMVSGWTIALTLDALKSLLNSLENSKYDITYIKDIYNKMNKDYYDVLIKDDIPAGFIYLNEGNIEYILHPLDKKSNIKYRLLPLTRGMIATLYSKEEVEKYLDIINNYLSYADGVRLMSDPIKYKGGRNDLFNRAETAANFGREIGLQYVHAHIRYCEAMAKIGNNKLLYEGINKIVPIGITSYLKNAEKRQENVYFSSSDGAFYNRYEVNDNFNKLKTQEVNVKAGWRLYSSGPGIFLNQLYSHFYGVRSYKNDLLIDPVLPLSMNDSTLSLNYNDHRITIHYNIESDSSRVYKLKINNKLYDECLTNRYRNCGIIIPREEIKDDLVVEVYCK